MEPLKKKYGLVTAIAMVVGIVIGSGVFFKAGKILNITGGNLPLAILAWALGGLVMIVCAYTFATMATRYQKVNGVVDYAEATVGKGYAYTVGWFMTIIYYPAMTSVVAWLCGMYTGVLFGFTPASAQVMTLAAFFMVASFAVNSLSPIIAGKLQVSTTIIKLIPLLLMAIVGLIIGLVRGVTVQNFSNVVVEVNKTSSLFSAVCATSFAYEGWIIATSINAELKDSKKNLPKALVWGSLIVVGVYILYYVGLAGGLPNKAFIGDQTVQTEAVYNSFKSIFGNFAGTALTVFIMISCIGTLNGLMLGCTRGIYALAARNLGPHPDLYKQIDTKTNMPTASAILGLFLTSLWLVYFYGANLVGKPWFGVFSFDSSELPIITIYALYIPIFIMMMVKEKGLHWFKRFVMPSLAILGCILMVAASIVSHGMDNVYYLIVFAIVVAIGLIIYYCQKKHPKKQDNLKEETKVEAK